MNLVDEKRRSRRIRRLQFEIVDVDSELERLTKLHPDIRPTIDRARDLLGRYSHLLHGVNVVELFGSPQEKSRLTTRTEEVAA